MWSHRSYLKGRESNRNVSGKRIARFESDLEDDWWEPVCKISAYNGGAYVPCITMMMQKDTVIPWEVLMDFIGGGNECSEGEE